MPKQPYKRDDPEEDLFRECLLKHHGIESCRSTGKIDMEYHIDLYLGNGLSVDVKRQKKVNGTDRFPSEKYTWLELNNSSGRRGWLYGRATHIAFALGDKYLMVDRRHLVDYTSKIIDSYQLKTDDGRLVISSRKGSYEPYKIYSRNGLDKVIMVELSDLSSLTHLIVKREVQHAG